MTACHNTLLSPDRVTCRSKHQPTSRVYHRLGEVLRILTTYHAVVDILPEHASCTRPHPAPLYFGCCRALQDQQAHVYRHTIFLSGQSIFLSGQSIFLSGQSIFLSGQSCNLLLVYRLVMRRVTFVLHSLKLILCLSCIQCRV